MTYRLIRRMSMVVAGIAVLVTSCTFPILPKPDKTSKMGILAIDIDYAGTFYHETFDYSREATNIKHYVLVMPASEAGRASAGEIFTTLGRLTGPDAPMINLDGEDISWTLNYLYEAPEGHFSGEFEPGDYSVAVAFIAAPLSREESGVSEDVILYPGITGGGASTEYKGIVIRAGQTADVKFILTDNNGWACPWLSVYNGHAFERRTEILRNLRGKQNEQTEVSLLGDIPVVEGVIRLDITEEKHETTFIDEVYLVVEGVKVRAEAGPGITAQVATRDQNYLTIASGESCKFDFVLPGSFNNLVVVDVSLVVTGFYVPLD